LQFKRLYSDYLEAYKGVPGFPSPDEPPKPPTVTASGRTSNNPNEEEADPPIVLEMHGTNGEVMKFPSEGSMFCKQTNLWLWLSCLGLTEAICIFRGEKKSFVDEKVAHCGNRLWKHR
jgi:hypothetical protein